MAYSGQVWREEVPQAGSSFICASLRLAETSSGVLRNEGHYDDRINGPPDRSENHGWWQWPS